MDNFEVIINEIKNKNSKKIQKIKNELLLNKYLLIICGPTATGKSKVGLILAKILDTNIISVDSMQSYKGMDIGTDKQDFTKYNVLQFLINICKPDYLLTSVEYRDIARQIINTEFFNKNKIPILVGGSGLHIRAIVDNLMQAPQGDYKIRKEIKDDIKKHGIDFVYEKLKKVDPSYASKISINDERRIIRALEIYEKTGKKYSDFLKNWQNRKSIYNCIFIGLNSKREEIYKNIENRVDKMIANGLVDEVRNLINAGYKDCFSLKQAIGYKELINYFDGKQNLDTAINEIKKNTKHLAKKQLTWFKADNRINWIDITNYDNIYDLINEVFNIILNVTKKENLWKKLNFLN